MKTRILAMMAAAMVFGTGTAMAGQCSGGKAVGGHSSIHKAINNVCDRGDKGKDARDNAKDKASARKDKRDDAKEKADGDRENKRENNVDKRQDNQEKRIQHGIDKGYLTPEETKSLKDEQQKISDMESSYKSDGKLTGDEMKSLRGELNVASANIWAEKHDTDGNQMAAYRFGKNVFAKDSFTSQMANQNMTGADAKALTSDFRKMMGLKNSLANDNLSAEARAQKQSEYDTLLNKYFEVR